jgi:hypothetical protein
VELKVVGDRAILTATTGTRLSLRNHLEDGNHRLEEMHGPAEKSAAWNRNWWLGTGTNGLEQELVARAGIDGMEQESVAWRRNEWPEQESVAYAGMADMLKNDWPLWRRNEWPCWNRNWWPFWREYAANEGSCPICAF